AERAHEGPVERVVDGDREQAHQHRGPRVVEGVERRREHLDAGVAGEAECVPGERLGRRRRVGGAEAAVLVDEADHGHAEHGETGPFPRYEAKLLLTKTFTCTAAAPIVAGPMSRITCRSPGSRTATIGR